MLNLGGGAGMCLGILTMVVGIVLQVLLVVGVWRIANATRSMEESLRMMSDGSKPPGRPTQD